MGQLLVVAHPTKNLDGLGHLLDGPLTHFLANDTFAICCLPSVCLSVYLSSVTLVHPTQAVEIFGNHISMAFGTLAIHWHPHKILRRSSHGNPSAMGVKHKRGSQI